MSTERDESFHPDTHENPTDDATVGVQSAEIAPGFVPPKEAVRARFRRLNQQTGGWEDAPVYLDGVATSSVDAASATPNLPLALPIPTIYRITWYSAKSQVLGYSKTWRVEASEESAGGASNTPRMWPAAPPNASAVPKGYLSPSDTLHLMQGLGALLHQVSQPLVTQVHVMAEQHLARERAFFEAQLARERQAHQEQLERDRQWSTLIRDTQDAPREKRIELLETNLRELLDDESQEAENEQGREANAYELAGKIAEEAPEIIRALSQEIRHFRGEEPPALGKENDDHDTD